MAIKVLFNDKPRAVSISLIKATEGCMLQNNFTRDQYATDMAALNQAVVSFGEELYGALEDALSKVKVGDVVTLNIQIFDKPLAPTLLFGGEPQARGIDLSNIFFKASKYSPDRSGYISFVKDLEQNEVDPNKPIYSAFNTGNVGNTSGRIPGIVYYEEDVEDTGENKAGNKKVIQNQGRIVEDVHVRQDGNGKKTLS